MTILDNETNNRPAKKGPRPPKIYTNNFRNMCRSVERLARWVLRADVTDRQVSQARAAKGFLQIRTELEKSLVARESLALARERFTWEQRIDARLEVVEEALQEGKSANRAY